MYVEGQLKRHALTCTVVHLCISPLSAYGKYSSAALVKVSSYCSYLSDQGAMIAILIPGLQLWELLVVSEPDWNPLSVTALPGWLTTEVLWRTRGSAVYVALSIWIKEKSGAMTLLNKETLFMLLHLTFDFSNRWQCFKKGHGVFIDDKVISAYYFKSNNYLLIE